MLLIPCPHHDQRLAHTNVRGFISIWVLVLYALAKYNTLHPMRLQILTSSNIYLKRNELSLSRRGHPTAHNRLLALMWPWYKFLPGTREIATNPVVFLQAYWDFIYLFILDRFTQHSRPGNHKHCRLGWKPCHTRGTNIPTNQLPRFRAPHNMQSVAMELVTNTLQVLRLAGCKAPPCIACHTDGPN